MATTRNPYERIVPDAPNGAPPTSEYPRASSRKLVLLQPFVQARGAPRPSTRSTNSSRIERCTWDGYCAAAALWGASDTGFSVSGVFREQADFAIVVLFQKDDPFGHPRFS